MKTHAHEYLEVVKITKTKVFAAKWHDCGMTELPDLRDTGEYAIADFWYVGGFLHTIEFGDHRKYDLKGSE